MINIDKLKSKTSWTGIYRGLNFEIINFNTSFWCYYLFMHLDRIPEENNPDSFWINKDSGFGGMEYYSYFSHKLLNDIYWHGGLTYYDKIRGFDEDGRVIKVGCDFQHLYNENINYSLNDVVSELERTIDSFRELIPNYKYWCIGNGNLYLPEEGKEIDGSFRSYEYFPELKEKE